MLIDRCFIRNAFSNRLGDESSSFLVGRNPSSPRNHCVEFAASPSTRWLIGFPISSVMISTLVQGSQAPQSGCTTFARFDSNVVQATVWLVERPSSPFSPSVRLSNRSIATSATPHRDLPLFYRYVSREDLVSHRLPCPIENKESSPFRSGKGSVLFLPLNRPSIPMEGLFFRVGRGVNAPRL